MWLRPRAGLAAERMAGNTRFPHRRIRSLARLMGRERTSRLFVTKTSSRAAAISRGISFILPTSAARRLRNKEEGRGEEFSPAAAAALPVPSYLPVHRSQATAGNREREREKICWRLKTPAALIKDNFYEYFHELIIFDGGRCASGIEIDVKIQRWRMRGRPRLFFSVRYRSLTENIDASEFRKDIILLATLCWKYCSIQRLLEHYFHSFQLCLILFDKNNVIRWSKRYSYKN